jgi:E3 ubiquitin-protein ligase HERC3
MIAPELPKPIVQVSCGNGHAFAIDSVGNLYGWGQNFDKQLGLYTKQIEELSKHKTVSIEEMMFLPRFIPISLKYPIKKVSCGGNFTVVLTCEGQILSWGAGECGQLGTGRCTNKILPSIEIFSCSRSMEFIETQYHEYN